MSIQEIDFSKTLTDDQVFESIMSHYSTLSKEWISHQWNWMNNVYAPFKDHYKYMIVISLIEKTLQFYDQMQIDYSYDEYYSKTYLQIEKFSITELCEKLDLPKETVRRKVLELEKIGVIKRTKKQIIIDRNAFAYVKPIQQIPLTSKYIVKVSELLGNDKMYSKKFDAKFAEKVIKKNFSLCWRWFYRMQIPVMIGYQKIFKDLSTFHIWGTIGMNQAFNYKINFEELGKDYNKFNKILLSNTNSKETSGVSAMSISDMTRIPRATVIRKCKFLMKNNYVQMNEKKQYFLSGKNTEKILPYQKEFFKKKARFLTRILNLIAIS